MVLAMPMRLLVLVLATAVPVCSLVVKRMMLPPKPAFQSSKDQRHGPLRRLRYNPYGYSHHHIPRTTTALSATRSSNQNHEATTTHKNSSSAATPAAALTSSLCKQSAILLGRDPKNSTSDNAVYKRLVELGRDFASRQKADIAMNIMTTTTTTLVSSPWTRVPACVAHVEIQTTLFKQQQQQQPCNNDYHYVLLNGRADAMVSRGLLALLSQTLWQSRATATEVLQLDAQDVTDLLNLRHALSKGRNDGLASMVKVLQEQVRNMLLTLESDADTREYGSRAPRPKNDTTTAASTVSATTATVGFHNGATTCSGKDKHADNSSLHQTQTQHHQQQQQQPTVAMLLSGGVDSSVALNLLVRQNYNVTAFYLKIWLEDELSHLATCPWEDDYRVCQQVCAQANVPLETLSLQDEYKQHVISYTIAQAQRGRTPNPDVMCNSRVKFGCFYNAIQGRGFDHVATGHYAQLMTIDNYSNSHDDGSGNSKKRLLRAPDPVKDQSYFLCTLTQAQLANVLFPIGGFEKNHVRELAQEFDLPNKQRPDSQGLCFLGKVKFDEFLAAYLGKRPGDIVDARTGEVLGRHCGVWYHTVGQRKGIGKVLDPKATSRGPWYVVAKDPERAIVYISNEYDQDVFAQPRSDFDVEDIQWIAGSPPSQLVKADGTSFRPSRFEMKIRHGPRLVEGLLTLTDASTGNVKLDSKDGGLAPGQYVAFYELEGSECFGGGVISERHWARFLQDREKGVGALTITS